MNKESLAKLITQVYNAGKNKSCCEVDETTIRMLHEEFGVPIEKNFAWANQWVTAVVFGEVTFQCLTETKLYPQ